MTTPPPTGSPNQPPQPGQWPPAPQGATPPYGQQPTYPGQPGQPGRPGQPQGYPQPGQPQGYPQPPIPPQPQPSVPPLPPVPPQPQGYPQPQPYRPPQPQPPLPPYQPPQGAPVPPPPAPGPAPTQWQPSQAEAATGRPWLIPVVVIVSLVVIVGVFVAAAVRGDTGGDAAAQARDAVVRLTTALAEGDCAGVEGATTAGYFRSMNMTCEEVAENATWIDMVGMSFDIGEASVNGTSARVPIRIVVPEEPDQGDSGYFTVVRTGDSWRVSNDQLD